jgi:tRNA threonylcarbamoyladenosine modification (KEOPS) complex  Pcc1 subunit
MLRSWQDKQNFLTLLQEHLLVSRLRLALDVYMNLTLTTDHPYGHLQQLFASELARKHERSAVTIEDHQGKAAFHIIADDTAALRAALNALTSILGMYEKTKEAIHDERN